jgi:hypothetical protein
MLKMTQMILMPNMLKIIHQVHYFRVFQRWVEVDPWEWFQVKQQLVEYHSMVSNLSLWQVEVVLPMEE